jgi:beta-glucuronidase
MRPRLLAALGILCLVAGLGSLALTAYLWLGDWPREIRAAVDHARSVAATEGRPPPPLLQNVLARGARSLAGRWQAIVDPSRVGLSPLTLGMLPRNVQPESTSDLVEFSFDGGLELDVPGDWNTQDPRLFFYRGLVWYRRAFEHERRPGRRVFLYVGAANYRAGVTLNGRRVGEHVGGFTPWNVEVTDALRDGENELVVAVDAETGPDDVPTQTNDWLDYGGLTRDVLLVDVPETFLRAWHVQLAPGRPDLVRGWARLDGPDAREEVVVAIPELGAEVRARPDAEGLAVFELPVRPEPWSPERPRLYRVQLRAGADEVAEEIGFRTLEVRGRELLLNGEPIFLRGVSLHEEAPFGRGRAHGPGDAQTLLGWARELDANFVRLAHYPHDEHTARLADRLGLLVWEEIPVYWNVAFTNPATLELARAQLGELVERDRNRASVILWSIGNETPNTPERLAFMRSLAEHARALDPTRPVTAALLLGPAEFLPTLFANGLPAALGASPETWEVRIDDPLGEVVDVAAVNEYFGWYYPAALGKGTPLSMREARRIELDNLPRIRFEIGAAKPFVASELGAGALAGFHAPEEELAVFSEELQALVYRRQLEMLGRQPGLVGISPWVLKDFRSPLRLHPRFQDYRNRKGLVADDGTRKQAFFVLRDHYRARRAAEDAR